MSSCLGGLIQIQKLKLLIDILCTIYMAAGHSRCSHRFELMGGAVVVDVRYSCDTAVLRLRFLVREKASSTSAINTFGMVLRHFFIADFFC